MRKLGQIECEIFKIKRDIGIITKIVRHPDYYLREAPDCNYTDSGRKAELVQFR